MKRFISIRELTTRINRRLSKDSKKLLKYKPRITSDNPVDEYAVVDINTNAIINFHMAGELEDFARSLGCLKTLEEVAGY
jgi:hypothetical protein